MSNSNMLRIITKKDFTFIKNHIVNLVCITCKKIIYNNFPNYIFKCIPTNYVREFNIHNEYITKIYDKIKKTNFYNMQAMHDILIKISCLILL